MLETVSNMLGTSYKEVPLVKYLRTLAALLVAAVRLGAVRRFWFMLLVGVLAKVSMLTAFVVTIKVVVRILHLPGQASVEGGHGTGWFLAAVLLAIPVLFFVAGGFVYYSQMLSADFVRAFEAEVRERNFAHFMKTVAYSAGPERREMVRGFLNQDDPNVVRAAGILIGGIVDALQAALIIFVVLVGLAFHDTVIFLMVFLVTVLVLPIYVRSHNRRSLQERRQGDATKKAIQNARKGVLAGMDQAAWDPSAVWARIEGVIFGETYRQQAELKLRRESASRRTFPIVYGLLGLLFSLLLWRIVAAGLPAKPEAIVGFVITAFMLRFVASTLTSLLNSLRQINMEYWCIHRIRALFGREGV